ncbi:MAG TPA: mucoidy inhibitor MuiA family protein [Ktedonobacterales bacterium]|nr:mucoidy inhibitor MuiA family protein [Ktedonobacterales bacterium]
MDLDLTTTIAGVTVYPDRALVTRHGEAQVDSAGTHALRIAGLPAAVRRDSLRATGRGPAGTRILGVEQAAEFHAAAPEEALERVRDDITLLEHEVALLEERERGLEEQRGWLRGLGEQSARSLAWGIARGTAKTDDAGAFFTYAANESQRLAVAALDLTRQHEETQRALDARRREYAQLGGGQQPDRLAATIRIETAAPGTIEVDLSYLIAGAGWQPRYDARVDVAAARMHLTQQALVSQHTGEDWHQVALALSTARPSLAVRLPDDPDPWYIDVVQPPPPPMPMAGPVRSRAIMAAPAGFSAAAPAGGMLADGMEMVYSAAMPAPREAATVASADIDRAGSAQVFRLPGGVDVPSDGTPHTLGLGEDDLPCRLDYIAAPVIASGAHLRAVAANATGRVLLPGELHVFHSGAAGDEYVGATALDITAEGAELKLYLGVDDNVTVKRELIERETDKGNILQSGIRRITYGYRVTLGNRTDRPQRVLLKDRLPVPRHERIKLKVLDLKPQPTERTRLEQLTWEVQLAPNEERQIEWRFVVESPADVEVAGLA